MQEIVTLAEQIAAHVVRLDVLINNAGIIRRADSVEFSELDWDEVMDVVRRATDAVDEFLADGVPTRTAIENEDPIDPDKLIAFEVGWRARPLKRLYVDVVAFHNHYDDVLTYEFGLPYREGKDQHYTLLPLHLTNDMKGHTAGLELFVDWQATDRWRLRNSYSFLDKQIDSPNPRLAMDAAAVEQHDGAARPGGTGTAGTQGRCVHRGD